MLLRKSRERLIDLTDRNYHDYVGFARWYYRRQHFPLYQIIWPSNDGHYPWSERALGSFKEWQPVLGTMPNGIGPTNRKKADVK